MSIKSSIFTFLLLSSLLSSLSAQSITEEQAKLVAKNFFYQENANIAARNQVQVTAVKPLTAENGGEALFYLCQVNETGSVVVANDTRVKAVLGYSTESGEIQNISPAFEAYLNRYKKQLATLKAKNFQNAPAAAEAQAEWQTLLNPNFERTASAQKTASAVSPLLACTWGQGAPYNNQCPWDATASARTVTGCVATAMAQVMHYHKHPSIGVGSSSYSSDYGTLSAAHSTTTFNWNNMPNSNASNSTNTEIPKLMKHCGVSVSMDYGVGSSGADSYDAADAFEDHFGYSNDGMIDESSYTYSNWKTFLKGKLNSSLPLYFRGSGPDGGHAWVCDGYDASDYFHMNWGWSGSSNGWYSVGDLSPGSYTFDDGNRVIANTPIRANLIPNNLTAPSAVNTSTSFNVSVTVMNIGLGRAANSYVKFYFSTDGTLSANDTYLGLSSVSSISGIPLGVSQTVTKSVIVSGTTSGYILAKVDGDDFIFESSEADNVASKPITIRYINVSPTTFNLYGNATTQSVVVSTNSNWTVTSNASWITTGTIGGTVGGTVFFNVYANPNTTARTGTVTFNSNGIIKTVTFNQGAKPAITVSPTNWSTHYANQAKSFTVTTTVPLTITDNATWITNSVASMSANGSFTVTLAENTTTLDRTGTVTLSGYGVSATIAVSQKRKNNEVCSAIPLSVFSGPLYLTQTFTNQNATTSLVPANTTICGNINNDVWFSFVVPASGTFTIETSSSYSPPFLVSGISDAVMAVYSAASCTAPMTFVACNDNYGTSNMPKLAVQNMTPGTQMYLRIGGVNAATGTFTVLIKNTYDALLVEDNGNEIVENEISDEARISDNQANTSTLTAYPNPANEVLKLNIQTTNAETSQVILTDLSGKVVYQQALDLNEGETQTEINTQTLPTGIYLLNINGNTVHQTQKVMVNH
ncbi:MAG: C10 family peptidase [Bacteroidia bacterium]